MERQAAAVQPLWGCHRVAVFVVVSSSSSSSSSSPVHPRIAQKTPHLLLARSADGRTGGPHFSTPPQSALAIARESDGVRPAASALLPSRYPAAWRGARDTRARVPSCGVVVRCGWLGDKIRKSDTSTTGPSVPFATSNVARARQMRKAKMQIPRQRRLGLPRELMHFAREAHASKASPKWKKSKR